MKNTILKLLLLMLAMAMVFSFASCGKEGTNDGGGNDDGGTGEVNPPDDGNQNSEELVLITGGKANFQIVVASGADGSTRKSIEAFVSDLQNIGVDVEKQVNDSAKETDCEIIVGTGVKNRDEKYVLNARDYGADGYVIKIVDNKVLIGGGSAEQTKTAFDYFVKNVVKLTSKTKEMNEFALERSYEKLKETKYLIESIEIGGVDLSNYVFVSNADGRTNPSINGFREDLYAASGYWLEKVDEDEIPEGKNVFSVKMVDDAGATGFRAYVDSDKNFIVECSYENAIDTAFSHIADDCIFDGIGNLTISKSYDKTYPVNVVYYAQFGAIGDGKAEDFQAIYNAHVFANQGGQKVMGDGPNARYYIHAIPCTIPVQTDVDFNGATFHLDDRGSEVHAQRSHIFTFVPEYEAVSYDAPKLEAMFGNDIELRFGDTSIPWLAELIETTSFVQIRNNHKDYIRHGANISSGQYRRDIVVVNPDGTLNEDTPVIWDFVAGDQILNNGLKLEVVSTHAIELITIRRADETPITMENGNFERDACEVVAETGYENKYVAYGRGLGIQRCNVTIKNLNHKIISEPYLPTSGYGYDADMKLRHSYPYGGFLAFGNTYNCYAIDCNLNAHTTYHEAKTTTATPVAMGTYDLTVGNSTNIYLEGLTNGVDICDTQYWGIMCSNGAKNMHFLDCSLNRFDAHEGFWNASLVNCEYGHTINVIGGGYFYCENTTKAVGTTFISLRGDYGSTFNGTIELVNCTHKGLMSYRGQDNENRGLAYPDSAVMTVITGGYSDVYTGEYQEGNAGAFPYLKWDFGYTCYMPQNVILNNFVFEHGTPVVFFNVGDACFNKPEDFVHKSDYEGKTINGRPMTEFDVYYNQYQITQSLTFKNMDPFPVCSNENSYLYETLTPKIRVEYD